MNCTFCLSVFLLKVSNGAKIRNRYNQVPHLTQDTNGKVTNSQTSIAKELIEANDIGRKAVADFIDSF